MSTADTPIVIRRAGAADTPVLARLAALDSAAAPGGDSLIAERGGVAVAALDLADGRVVADPFAPTGDLVELLRLRAVRVRGTAARRRRGTWPLARRHHGGIAARV